MCQPGDTEVGILLGLQSLFNKQFEIGFHMSPPAILPVPASAGPMLLALPTLQHLMLGEMTDSVGHQQHVVLCRACCSLDALSPLED